MGKNDAKKPLMLINYMDEKLMKKIYVLGQPT